MPITQAVLKKACRPQNKSSQGNTCRTSCAHPPALISWTQRRALTPSFQGVHACGIPTQRRYSMQIANVSTRLNRGRHTSTKTHETCYYTTSSPKVWDRSKSRPCGPTTRAADGFAGVHNQKRGPRFTFQNSCGTNRDATADHQKIGPHQHVGSHAGSHVASTGGITIVHVRLEVVQVVSYGCAQAQITHAVVTARILARVITNPQHLYPQQPPCCYKTSISAHVDIPTLTSMHSRL